LGGKHRVSVYPCAHTCTASLHCQHPVPEWCIRYDQWTYINNHCHPKSIVYITNTVSISITVLLLSLFPESCQCILYLFLSIYCHYLFLEPCSCSSLQTISPRNLFIVVYFFLIEGSCIFHSSLSLLTSHLTYHEITLAQMSNYLQN
jgi:hypothetical protein